MFEQFGFETLTPKQASVYLALTIGVIFGALAQISNFCIRRGLVGAAADRRPALATWMTALIFAIVGTQLSVAAGWIEFSEHRFLVSDIPILAIAVGGLLFGAGMVLTRGCISRLTVLGGTGNLRALTVLLIFAVIAHATLKGVFASIRTSLGAVTSDLGGITTVADLPGGGAIWTGVLIAIAAFFVWRGRLSFGQMLPAALIGLLVPLGWVGTGYILFDEFDPIAMESLSFTSPAADTLFWSVASTSIPGGFGVGLVGGVILGSAAASLFRREFQLQSFENPQQTLRYVAGAVLMGIGGVLAGGCTVGAGLSGVPTLSIAAILALAAIAVGAVTANALLTGRATRQGVAVPAE